MHEQLRANVMAVDDSQALRSILGEVLSRGGHEVFLAQSGEEALDLLDQIHIDLVVADLILPKMDGYELCRRIKDLNPECPIPVLLLTSKSDLDAKLAGFEAGADDYILKPFRHEELIARVRAQLRMKGLQEELRDKNRKLQHAQSELEAHIQELEDAYREIKLHENRTRKDLQLASRVQRALLPQKPPEIPGLSLAFLYQPAQTVAGDFFDFLPLEDGRLGIAIGDVAGKGAGASLLMVLAVSALRRAAHESASPAAVLQAINDEIRAQYGAAEMITLFYGVLDPAARRFHYSTAGHEPGLLLRAGATELEHLKAGGPFLGVFPELTLAEEEVQLGHGDRLLLITDGVLERFEQRDTYAAVRKLTTSFVADREMGCESWLHAIPTGDVDHPEPDDTTAVLLSIESAG